jgi:hypothetical protein
MLQVFLWPEMLLTMFIVKLLLRRERVVWLLWTPKDIWLPLNNIKE